MKPLRVAVIGVGHLGRIHARLLAAMPGVELVGVADPAEAQRRQVAEDCHTEPVADYRELIGRIDAAVVAAPTRFHHAIGLELLAAGIHLLVEKPLAPSLAEADELVDTARQQGLVLQVGHVERFNPAWGAVLPYLRDVKYVEAARVGGFTGRSTDIGVVLDLMIHDLDLLVSLVRSPLERVEALGVSLLSGHEDVANARLVFQNGCVAALSASRASYRPQRTMQLWSPTAFAAIDFAARTASLVRPCQEILERRFNAETLPAEQKARLKDELFSAYLPVETFQPPPADALTAELHDFADSIRTGRMPRVPGEQAREAIAVAEQVLSKIAAHRWDGHAAGRIGPLGRTAPSVIPAPHFDRFPQPLPGARKEAG